VSFQRGQTHFSGTAAPEYLRKIKTRLSSQKKRAALNWPRQGAQNLAKIWQKSGKKNLEAQNLEKISG
jgi:hypothetical protein